eukprot:gene23085-35375_t
MPVTAIPGGESEAVRNYALQHAVLKLVDDMVAYLLEDRPMNPARSLVSYFSKLAGVGELEVNDRAASISVTMSDKPLVEELRNLWEVCGCDVNEFNIKLKKALPDKAQAAWKQLGSSLRPAKPPAQIDVSENSSGAGDVTLISTDQPTKFEATDDINRGSADIVTRVSFYNEGYQPAIDVLEVVSSLNEWHAIGRQLWPASAIRRLSNTCKLMTERHNYGEPIDIVIPLYLYSVAAPCLEGAAEEEKPPVEGWKELIIFEESDVPRSLGESDVFVARYELDESDLRNHPMQDAIAWLPLPHFLAGSAKKRVPSNIFYGRNNAFCWTQGLSVGAALDASLHSEYVFAEATEVQDLVAACFQQHNQQEYVEALRQRLVDLREKGSLLGLEDIIEYKLGCSGFNGNPTPLVIAHALDLQRIVFHARPAALLGRGLDLLESVTNKPALKHVLRRLRKYSWLTTLDSSTNWTVSHNADLRSDVDTPDDYLDIFPTELYSTECVGWWGRHKGGDPAYFLKQENVKVHLGTWMLDQVRPLLFYVNRAMQDMSREIKSKNWRCAPEGLEKGYRGLRNVKLDRKEWLYPLNSMFQVRSLLTEEQKRVLGKQNFQLFEIEEVDDDGLQVIQIRKSLAQAMTKEAAVPSKWYWTVTVNYDPHDQCPVNTTNVRSECPTHLARALQSESERLVDEGKTVLVDFSSGRDTLNVIADILRIPTPKGPDFAEIEWHRQRIRGRAAATDCFKISAKKPTERWELVLEVREDTGHDGFAIKDEGAEILHSILKRNVRLQRIDVRNNKITSKGAALLLSSLRVNHNIHQLAIADRSGSLLDSHLHHGEKKWERLLERLQLQLCVFAALVVRFAYENKFKLPFLNLLRLRRLDSVPSKLSDGCDTPITRVNSEFSATERTYEQHSDKGEETRDAKVLMEIQSVINLRCQHHKGTVDLDGVRDFGRHWPQYAASAFWDVAQLDVNMSDLFDEQPHEIASFFALLAENCILNTGQKAFPKLPGALVSAARVGDLKLVDLLLFMCCNKEETDDFGETPFLKLKRRSQDRHRNLNQIELCKLEKHLRVPLQYVTSARKIKQNDVEWQLKNFALEVVRICEAKEDAGTVGLLDEIQKNISQHTKAPRAPGDILDLLRQRAKRCISQARSCSHLSRTPIGRMNTTLLCYYLYCSASQDIEKSLIPGEETRKDYLRSTGRRKNPISEEDWPNWKDHAREKKYRPYLTRHLFGQSVELLWKANEEKEEKKERRRTAHGLYLFEHEFHGYLNTTRPMELKADPQLPSKEWALCEPKDEAPAIMQETGRKYVNVMGDVRKMTLVGYKKALWNVAQREPLGVRKKNASGVYVFKHDWFPDEDGDWDTQPAQEDCGESSVTLSDCLTRHTRTLYDPHIGGRCALVSAREGISKWAHLWASLCAVLSSTDEVDRAIFRSVQNVPEATFFAHMNLEKGALYGFPEISLWNVERRSYENRYLSKEELSSAENGAKQWKYLGHIPFIQLDENLILKDSTTTIEISAKTIRDQHEKDNADFSKDPLFRDLNRSSPSPEDVFGTEVFSITVGEVQQLVKTTKVTTSASFPIEFFRALVEIVTRVDFVLFFNIFRATPLSKLAFEWDECKKAARNLNTASLTRAEANRKAFTEPQRKYQQNVLYECRTLENKLLTDREQLESIHSQHGYLFTSGTNGNHNHIAPRTDRTVVFLSSPGIDFCFPQPTLQEAPKYFERVASKAENPESGWKYFKFGKEEELEHRVRVLYTSIFKAAQQQ